MQVLEDHFDVCLNSASSLHTQASPHDFALLFAGWMLDAEGSRDFNPDQVRALLDQMDNRELVAEVRRALNVRRRRRHIRVTCAGAGLL